MALGMKTRLLVAGAVVGAAMLALSSASAQIDPGTGGPPMPTPGMTPQTTPGVTPTTPEPLPDFNASSDAGMGGSGFSPPPSVPSPFGEDAGMGGSGFSPPSTLGGQDGGFGY